LVDAAEVPFEVEAGLGNVGLRQEIFRPVVEALAENDGAPKRVGDLAEQPSLAALPPGALVETLTVLIGAGRANPVQDAGSIEIARPRCQRLNAHLIERARVSGDVSWLASPVTGRGVEVGRFQQLFLAARARGLKKPEEWARDAWSILTRQNQSLIKDGQVLATPDENVRELIDQAKAFADRRLAQLKRLEVVS
jgi:hypothetical protein